VPLLILIVIAGVAFLAVVAITKLVPHVDVSEPAAIGAATDSVGESVAHRRRLRRFVVNRLDPKVLTGLALSAALVLAVGTGVVLAILAYLVRSNPQLRHIDNGVARWGHEHADRASTHGLNVITQLGNVWVVIGLAVVLAVVESVRAPSAWIVPFLVVVLGGEEILTTVVKELANRARPAFNPAAATLGPSFPSGHSATSAAFYAAAALLLARRRSPRRRSILAGAAAASRVLLDVHWLSDVIAGAALGWGWFAICCIAFGGRLLRYAAPAEQVVRAAETAEEATHGRRKALPGSRRNIGNWHIDDRRSRVSSLTRWLPTHNPPDSSGAGDSL
jgi:membrane-associated phospholipid phosphatase